MGERTYGSGPGRFPMPGGGHPRAERAVRHRRINLYLSRCFAAWTLHVQQGDRGQTSLVGGIRVSKGDLRVETYGTVDE